MGRYPSVSRTKYQLLNMKEKHQEIKRLDSLGMKKKEIAAEIGCAASNITGITGSEIYKKHMDVLRVARDSVVIDISQRITELGVKSMDLLENVVAGEGKGLKGQTADIGMRIRVAMDNLDRNPESAKVRTIQGNVSVSHIVGEDVLNRIKERAAAAQLEAKKAGMVEAEFEVADA